MDRELLKRVSRSFYLSMAWLPPAMRDAVALAYMLARATDSVADTSTAAVQDRADALRRMAGVIAGAGEENTAALCQTLADRLAPAQDKPAEAELLRRFPQLLQELDAAPEDRRELIRGVLATIIQGQLWDLTYFTADCTAVADDAMTDLYAHRVAGCVGEFWTRLGRAALGEAFCPAEREDIMCQAAVRYGKGLQLVNILRDMQEDAARGRRYLCSDPAVWADRAERYLADGIDYARRLGGFRLRFASMLPALLGIKTLRLIRTRNGTARVKIPRRAVYASMLRAAWCACTGSNIS